MVNQEALKQIELLTKEYEAAWGQKVDYTLMPPGITQEKMVSVLKVMIGYVKRRFAKRFAWMC